MWSLWFLCQAKKRFKCSHDKITQGFRTVGLEYLINSTVLEEHKKDTTTDTDILEIKADFTIKFKERKTKEEVERDLEKLCDSNLEVGLGWDTIEKCSTYFIIQIKLDEGETMNKLWPWYGQDIMIMICL